MQQRSKAKLKIFGAALIAVCLCIAAALCGTTILKNTQNDNTSLQILDNFGNVDRLFTANSQKYVKIGGSPIGISISAEGLIVMGESEVLSNSKAVFPAHDTSIKKGDLLLSVNGEEVHSIYALKLLLDKSEDMVDLILKRGDSKYVERIQPVYDDASRQKRLGLILKEDIGGVGTLTFVTRSGAFAALGHFIIDSETGLSSELDRGNIYPAAVEGVIKGEKGKAGGLVADINRLSEPLGRICQNTQIGLYGEYLKPYDGELYRIAERGEAQLGAAKVYTTIDGSKPKFYDIDIVKVVSQASPAEKGMVIAVKDKELLEKTGGIVQGMSGSPIIQNGLLIGAVTHVFIQDPTRGYAVHSRFMYDNAVTYSAENSVQYIEMAA